MLVGLEPDAEAVIVDAQVAIRTAHDGVRPDDLHFLCHHADIGLVAAVIGKPIETQAVVEASEKDDVVLDRDIGSAPAATTAAAATTATTSATRATTTPPPARAPPPPPARAPPPPMLACPRADCALAVLPD